IFPHLSVADNIAYGLRRARISRQERQRLVDEMLELVRLPGYGARRAHELSGGQRQRIALARALILRPKVLLLDEPLGALDKQLREQMQGELRRLQRAVGITFVFVTHDQEEALTLSDRIAVMSRGKVLQVDTPARLYEAPKTRSVAGFVGSMNFLDARVLVREGDHARLEIEALGVRDLRADHLPAHGRVCVAVRPENIALHADDPGGAALPGLVEARSYLGERSHWHVRVPGMAEPLAVSTPNGVLQAGAHAAEGAPVWVRLGDEALILLNAE
ncbi:MAG: ABC transporter ATP-binding protein, partial [Pseudomonadota bacterium]